MSLSLLLCGLGPALAGVIEDLPSVVGPGADQPILHAQPAGDLDGDGLGDMILGAPYDDNEQGHEAGAVYVLYGEAWDSVDRWTPIRDVAVQLSGETSQDHAGYDLAPAGDLDGDNLDDFVVGAPDASADTPATGKMYVVFGGEANQDGDLSEHPYFYGAERFSHSGFRVHPAGDIDGDGMAEMLMATPYPMVSGEPGVGYLAMIYGRESNWSGPFPILMNYSNDVTLQTTTADAMFLVYDNGTYAGRAATVVPDQDGDGLPDVMMGAPGYTDERTTIGAPPPHEGLGPDEPGTSSHIHNLAHGAAYLFSSKPREVNIGAPFQIQSEAAGIIRGDNPGDLFPWVLDTLNDGRVLATAPDALATAGEVYLFGDLTGEFTASDADVAWQGSTAGDLLGWGVAAIDGMSGDVVAALGEPGWSAALGQVVLVDETSGLVEAAAAETLRGCWPNGQAGFSVRSHPGPDPTGADLPWAGITAPGASVYDSGDGVAYILTADALAGIGEDCDLPEVDALVDADNDGVYSDEDCDDGASWIYPGSIEVCGDGIDDDCDGEADEACGPALPDEGCGGCASSGSGGSGGWWLMLALGGLAVRRRSKRDARSAASLATVPLATLVLATASTALAPKAQAQEALPLVRIWGSAAEEYLQGPIVSGDFDGDGLPDLAVANYRGFAFYYATGEVHLLGNQSVDGVVELSDIRTTIYGLTEHDYLGSDIAVLPSAVGEADSLLVGENFAGLTANDPGTALLFPSPLSGGAVLPADSAALGIQGDDNSDRLGDSVQVVGDLNGDGIYDVIVTAPIRDQPERTWSGSVYVFMDDLTQLDNGGYRAPDLADSRIDGPVEYTWAGWTVDGPGDIDGDGLDDLIVGTLGGASLTNAGRLHVYMGLNQNEVRTTDQSDGVWNINSPDAYLGHGLSGGDIDGDGRAEVAISSFTAENGAGRVWLMDGPPGGSEDVEVAAVESWTGTAGSGAGFSLAMGPALLVGAPYSSTVTVLDENFYELGVLEGTGELGHWVGWVDDFDNDAVPEAALVAPAQSGRWEKQGAAFILSGDDVLDGVFPESGLGLLDADGDGVASDEDCNDADPRVFPDNDEICRDDLDNDCDGATDEQACVRGGCGCAVTPAPGAGLLVLIGLAMLRRRHG